MQQLSVLTGRVSALFQPLCAELLFTHTQANENNSQIPPVQCRNASKATAQAGRLYPVGGCLAGHLPEALVQEGCWGVGLQGLGAVLCRGHCGDWEASLSWHFCLQGTEVYLFS